MNNFYCTFSMSIFDPNGVVTYDQAITMTMRALGYTEAALNGVYPACFVSKAVSLGAMKNLHSGSGDANRADCAQLIFNVLQSPIGKVGNNNIWVAFGSGEAGWDSYDNMLVRLGAHLADDDCDNLDDNFEYDEAAKGYFTIVTMELCEAETTLIDLKPLLGHKISVYHNDECEIVAVAEVLTKEVTGKLVEADDEKDNKLAGLKFAPVKEDEEEALEEVLFFLNGYETENESYEADTEYTWTVEMKGGKIANVVACLDWVVTADKKVDNDDLEEIEDEDAPSLLEVPFAVVDEDADVMEINEKSFILEGVDSLEDIVKNNVVYVYAGGYDDDEELHVTKVQVGTQTVFGTVDEVASTGKKVILEDTTYAIHNQKGVENGIAAGEVNTWAKAGNEATLYLDCAGKFYTIKDAEDPESGYVVILKTQTKDTTATGTTTAIDNNNAKVKVFTADGETIVYLTKKISNAELEALEPGTVAKLTINKDDKVTKITTIVMSDDITDEEINKKGITSTKAEYLADSAVVFAFDAKEQDKSNEENWSVVKATSLWNKTVDTLSTNADTKGKVKVAVVTDATANDGDVSFGIVKSYSEIKDYCKIQVLVDGEAATVKWDKDDAEAADALTDGGILADLPVTLIAIKLDGNEVVSMEIFEDMDLDEKQFVEGPISGEKVTVDELNRMHIGSNTWYALDDEVVVYVYDGEDEVWSVKTVAYLNGLKADKYDEIMLFDTNKNDKEYYNVVIVTKNMD